MLASPWIGRTGKIAVLIAGLTILLDLIGPGRLERWADAAAGRRDEIAVRLRALRTARRLTRLVATMGNRAAYGAPLGTGYFTAAEFGAFAEAETRKRTEAENGKRTGQAHGNPALLAVQLREAARVFLLPRLPPAERAAFEQFPNTPSRLVANALPALAVPAGILLFRTGPPQWSLATRIVVSAAVPMAVAVLGGLVVSSPWVRLVAAGGVAATRSALTRVALALVGPGKDAHPLRWAAAALFLAGSLLDLLASW